MSEKHEPSYTIREFCAAEGITTPTFYKLKKQGLGPKEMRLGTAVRISHRARLAWQRARENPKGKEAEAVRLAAEALLKRSAAAVERAVASPNHVSKRDHRGAA
jgi:predicted DNA-binding transcriptional regulator AlpA